MIPNSRKEEVLFEIKNLKEDKNGCLNSNRGKNSGGYPFIAITKNKIKKHLPMNRVSYLVFNGDIPENIVVMHTCDNRGCVNPKHLKLGTFADNSRDMKLKNRVCFGERHPLAKLNNKKAREIIKEFNNSHNKSFLSRKYGIGRSVITKIIAGKLWIRATIPRTFI